MHDLNSRYPSASSLRHIRSDGSLLFSPFSLESFIPDIHFSTYRCIASNAVGSIISRDVNVKAASFA
ncbi:Down syndrome cell adhesion molecule-like protein Dscam2 [Leptotrombidium deliense]|uniref:Down syndrome cell adhesion molecule-like protein Dscam2 n=1 Tax=Leptotrombidium deliense TaxID=299467 RepID=A0A443SFL6_9ACAR|nr:Down syndrome cell adhesion molecule-like protein Dscam2 [Leptotrombidium deliense]